MDAILQALSDSHRRTMLAILRDHPAPVGELAAAVPIARPGVSRHLRVLREAGLVEAEKTGQRQIYRLREEPFADLAEWLAPYQDLWTQRLDALHTEVARGRQERRGQ